MRQTVKNRMIKNVQMMAVGMMATASIMGTAAAMGVKMDNIPFNVLANPFQAVMTQGVAAIESGTLITSYEPGVESITYEIQDEGTLTIKGEGELSVVDLDSPSSTFEGRQDIKKVVVEEGITSIGGFFFKNCANIAEIEFPQTLKSINGGAFVNLDALKQISIPDGVTEIGIYVFSNCNNLTEIHGMNGVKTITQAFGVSNGDELLETSLDTTNEYVLNYDWTTYGRKIKENKEWYYSEEDESFVADTNQIGSVVDDYYKIWSQDVEIPVVGEDIKQGVESQWKTADASNEDTLVYCTKASDWIITIPKDLVMSGDDESRAEYVVGIYGNVDPAKRVTVTPAPSFEMTNTGNAKVKYNAQVNQTVTGINGMDIIESPEADVDDASQMSGTITANLKRAGSYRGTMTFTVDYVDHT